MCELQKNADSYKQSDQKVECTRHVIYNPVIHDLIVGTSRIKRGHKHNTGCTCERNLAQGNPSNDNRSDNCDNSRKSDCNSSSNSDATSSNDNDDSDNLAQELNELSIQERQRVLYDLHGVENDLDKIETPHMMATSLQYLDLLLKTEIQKGTNAVLQMAEIHGHSRIHDPRFQLLFLRADMYNAEKAFRRMLLHLEQVLLLFGPSKIGRKVTLLDMNQEEREILGTGCLQILPTKDRSGRQIVFCSVAHGLHETFSAEGMLRAVYFTIMSALEEDEEFQKKGCVVVMSYFGFSSKFNPVLAWKAHKLYESLPIQARAHHALVKEKGFGTFIRFRKLWERDRRIRSRVHYGSVLEGLYTLMTFGIPTDAIPLELDGTLKKEQHLEWLQRKERAGLESFQDRERVAVTAVMPMVAQSSIPPTFLQLPTFQERPSPRARNIQSDLILNPSRNDVLFGRGRPIQEHPGNVVFNSLLEAVRDRYDSLRRSEKTALTYTIVFKIKRAGGRFLRQSPVNPELWEQVDDEMARVKVSHTFRSLRQIQKGKEPTDQGPKSTAST